MKSFAKGISEFGFFYYRHRRHPFWGGVGAKETDAKDNWACPLDGLARCWGDRRHLLATHRRPTYSSILMMKQK
jgi:hypothetical protein